MRPRAEHWTVVPALMTTLEAFLARVSPEFQPLFAEHSRDG